MFYGGNSMKKILITLMALGQIYAGGGCSKPKVKSVWDDGEAVAPISTNKKRLSNTSQAMNLDSEVQDARFRADRAASNYSYDLRLSREVGFAEQAGHENAPFPHRISSIDTGEDDNLDWKLSMQDTASAQDESSSGLRVSPTKVFGRRDSISTRQSQMLANSAAMALITQTEDPTEEQLAAIGEDGNSEDGE